MINANTVKENLRRVGTKAYFAEGSWTSMPFYCVIQKLQQNDKTEFEPIVTPAGVVSADYFSFIGPYDHDMEALSKDAVLLCNGKRYLIKKRRGIMYENKVLYFKGVLRLIQEKNNDKSE